MTMMIRRVVLSTLSSLRVQNEELTRSALLPPRLGQDHNTKPTLACWKGSAISFGVSAKANGAPSRTPVVATLPNNRHEPSVR